MIYFRVKADIPTDVLERPSRRAEAWLGQEILKDTDKFVPALTKSLANRAYSDKGVVVYPGPYARYLYYGKVMVGPAPRTVTDKNLVFNKSVHPQAQSHWFEASKALNAEKWVAGAARIVRDELDK